MAPQRTGLAIAVDPQTGRLWIADDLLDEVWSVSVDATNPTADQKELSFPLTNAQRPDRQLMVHDPGMAFSPDGQFMVMSDTSTANGGGRLNFDNNNRENWDPDANLTKGLLWPYCGKSLGIFKCPSDQSTVNVRGQIRPRVRSMSVLNWVGGRGEGRPMEWSGPGWKIYRKSSDMIDPGPVRTFVFLDEREDSINDAMFVVDMTGFPDTPRALRIIDILASYHGGAGGFSFADGHSEIKLWRDARTKPPLVKSNVIPYDRPSPDNRDITWMQERATRRE